MLSLRSYCFVLILLFIVFALAVWFVFIPCQIVEYNLGVNLFTSSLFTALTVLLVSWLSEETQKENWKSVEERVYRTLG